MFLHGGLGPFGLACRDRVAHRAMLLRRGSPGIPVLEITRQSFEIWVHALVEKLADTAHQDGVSENARHHRMELAVERDRHLGRVKYVLHAAQHVVHMFDVNRPNMEGGFGGDRPFEELARPQQLERAFIHLCGQNLGTRPVGDVDAGADANAYAPLDLEGDQRFTDSRAGDAKLIGQFALGRQAIADCELAGVDQLPELIGDLSVESTRFNGLDRHCHPVLLQQNHPADLGSVNWSDLLIESGAKKTKSQAAENARGTSCLAWNDGSATAERQLLTFQQLEDLSRGFVANIISGVLRKWAMTRRVQEGGRNGHGMEPDATVPQLAALGGVSVLAPALGMIAPANWVNLTLSARDVGGAIMPPGMVMDRDTPAAAMLDMAAVHPRLITASHGLEVRGDRELQARMENGVKVFDLETSVIRWAILPDVKVDAYAINGQVPGPRLHIRQGDRVRINVTNRLPESTTLHWHGLILPNEMDGPAEITQEPIPPGGSYRYEFTASQSGTYFYHSHDHVDRQQALGLYGALIIDPANPQDEIAADHDYVIQLQEWLVREGLTFPSMPMDGGQPNYFTINGRAYPSTDTIRMKVGETLKVRFIGTNNGSIHPMHIHGGPFEVVARDGETMPESARFLADTVNVGPGQRYDVVWQARRPAKWLIHCHIGHHTTNNNVEEKGGGGLMVVIDVQP